MRSKDIKVGGEYAVAYGTGSSGARPGSPSARRAVVEETGVRYRSENTYRYYSDGVRATVTVGQTPVTRILRPANFLSTWAEHSHAAIEARVAAQDQERAAAQSARDRVAQRTTDLAAIAAIVPVEAPADRHGLGSIAGREVTGGLTLADHYNNGATLRLADLRAIVEAAYRAGQANPA